jgi:hypothetical protein
MSGARPRGPSQVVVDGGIGAFAFWSGAVEYTDTVVYIYRQSMDKNAFRISAVGREETERIPTDFFFYNSSFNVPRLAARRRTGMT